MVVCFRIQEEREERHKYKGAVKTQFDDGVPAIKACKRNVDQLSHRKENNYTLLDIVNTNRNKITNTNSNL